MKIKQLDYKVYGKLISLSVKLGEKITFFYGRNESGKSTIFNSIYSMFYGFKPANRDKHPYVNWQQNEINFSCEIENNGELFEVERSLKSAPKLNITDLSKNSIQSFRNERLPFITNVSDKMYESVFYLTAETLNSIEQDTWENVQEQLIFNYGSDYLRNVNEVLNELDKEISSIWRKDKRGNPQMSVVLSEINELKKEKLRLELLYEERNSDIERLKQLSNKIETLSNQKKTINEQLKEIRTLRPYKDLNDKIEALSRRIYNAESFDALPDQILIQYGQSLAKLTELKTRTESLKEKIDHLKRDLSPLNESDIKLLELNEVRNEIESGVAIYEAKDHEIHRIIDERMRLNDKIAANYQMLFNKELTPEDKRNLKGVQVLDLITLVQKIAEGEQKNQEIIQIEKTDVKSNKLIMLAIGAIGAIFTLLGGLLPAMRVLSWPGLLMIGYAIASLLPLGSKKQQTMVDLSDFYTKINQSTNGITLPEYVYRDNDQRFFTRLEQLIALVIDEAVLESKLEQMAVEKKNDEDKLIGLMNMPNVDFTRGVRLTIQLILTQLEALNKRVAEETSKGREIIQYEEQFLQELSRYEAEQENHDALVGKILDFGDGDLNFGLKQIESNREVTQTIRIYQSELSNYDVDLEKLKLLEVYDYDLLEEQLEEVSELEKSLLTEKAKLTTEIENFKQQFNLEEVISNILSKQLEYDTLTKKRDLLMISYELLKWTDEKFRIENQPNIIQRVSELLSDMTGGKYEQVLLQEENQKYELIFRVAGELLPASLAFSKGTKQQLFLAYRIAVIEALDPEGNLPLVLDEALINWDQERFDNTMKVLSNLAEKRQIIGFTCHLDLANRLKNLQSVRVIEVENE